MIARRLLSTLSIVLLAALPRAVFAQSPKNSGTICDPGVRAACADNSQGGPAQLSAAVQVISVWGGARESIALKSDGSVWTWGLNSCAGLGTGPCGKLGDGTQIDRWTPVQVHGPGNTGYLNSVTAIMGGEHHNFAIKADGTLWAWGGNFVGQLGTGDFVNTDTPVQVSGLISVTKLGGRGYHSLAVTSDGKVWAWGWNSRGQLGHDTTGQPCPAPLFGTCSDVPLQVLGISNPLTVTGGGFFSLAVKPDHTVMGWGANELGELGDGTFTDRPAPVQASSVLSHVVQLSAGWKHAVALTDDGKVWTWGDNTNGEIGNGLTSTVGISVPFQVPGLSNVIGVSGGDRFTGILKADGTVWTWGWNGFGQLGDATFTDRSSPVQVHGLGDVKIFAARDYHDLAVKGDGTVWAWGSGLNGELGDNLNASSDVPVQVIFMPHALWLPILMQ
jgi:YD repeat-containing protein